MAKQVYALTNINHNGTIYPVGEPVNPELFTKDELRALYDVGSVEVRENVDEEKVAKTESEAPLLEKPEVQTSEKPEAKKVVKGPDTSVKAP